MKNKGFPDHNVKTVQSLYINTMIKTDKGTTVSNKEIHINRGVKQGCPMFPILFNIFIDEVIRQWQDVLIKDFKIGNTVLNTILFADDQAICSESEASLQRADNRRENIANCFNMRLSNMKKKTWHSRGKNQSKIVIDNKTIEQVSSSKYVGFNVSYCLKEDVNIKLNKFQRMCRKIRKTLRQQNLQSTQIKFYKIMAVPMLTHASKNWTINRSDKKKTESAEMKFLRSVAGYTLLDQKRSTTYFQN
jgi:hypothetical protein